jgi:lipid-A-disaccharide synthase
MKRILIVAGEPSADIHGANLVKAISRKVAEFDKNKVNSIEFIGIGGKLMKEAGVRVLFDADKIAVVGISEVIRHLGLIRQAFKTINEAVLKEHIDLGVLIDFPDFNLRLAKRLYELKIPLVYYISPQVWAWRKGRIKKIARYFKKVLVIFNFEESIYKKAGVDVRFVGHPLVKIVKMTETKERLLEQYNIPQDHRIIAMLPGSRTSEIKSHLPIMLETMAILNSTHKGLTFVVPVLSAQADICNKMVADFNVPTKVIIDDTYNAVGLSDFAVVTSGTATLETALLGTPMIVVYKVSFLSHIVARLLLSINRIGIVNIATGEDIVPELVQDEFKPERLADMIKMYLNDKKAYNRIKQGYLKLRHILTDMDASDNAASEIINLMGLSL